MVCKNCNGDGKSGNLCVFTSSGKICFAVLLKRISNIVLNAFAPSLKMS